MTGGIQPLYTREVVENCPSRPLCLAKACGLRWLGWAPASQELGDSNLFPALGATLFDPSLMFLNCIDGEAGWSQN